MLKLLLLSVFLQIAILPSQASSIDQLNFGVEITDYSPYYFLDEKQRYQGAAREIFDLFSEDIKHAPHYNAMPVPRLFSEFVKGNVDLKFPDNPLWSGSLGTKVKVFYSAPVFQINETLLVLKQATGEIPQNEILKVGTILGFSVPGIAKSVANNKFETVKTKEVEQLIHMLMSQRVQAVYFNESVAMALAKKMYPSKKLTQHSQYPPFQYAYHLSSINHPELIDAFNSFLISHSEQVAEIRQRYGLN